MTFSRASSLAHALGGVVHQAAPLQFAIQVHQPLLYNRSYAAHRARRSRALVATGLGAVTGAAVYGVAYERHQIGVTEATLPVSGLPAALDGLRIGFLTDIHHSAMVPADDVAYAVAAGRSSTKPDLIVLGGDYVTFGDRAFVGPVAELLAPLRRRTASLRSSATTTTTATCRRRSKRNTSRCSRTRGRGSRSAANGSSSPGSGSGRGDRRTWLACCGNARDTVLLLAHDPRRLTEAADARRARGVIRTHARRTGRHSGSRRGRAAPLSGPRGLGSRENTSIFVSRGVGTVYVPVRINCPPEVAIVTLKRRQQT